MINNGGKTMKKYVNMLRGLIAFFLLSFIPLILLTFYNHPSADDYSYGKFTYHVWNSTHSLSEVLKSAVDTSIFFWNNCDGLYSSAFLMALQPGIFGEKYYALTAFITMGCLILSNLFFAKMVLVNILKLSRIESIYGALLSAFMMIQWMPSGVQGIYWYDGSMNYTCFFSVLMLTVSMSIYAIQTQNKVGMVMWGVITSLLAFILAGGNHVTAFAGILYLFGVVVYLIINKRKHIFFLGILPFLAIMSGFLFNVLSPGTRARQAAFTERFGVVKTIIYASFTGCQYMDKWFGITTLICIGLMLPVFFNIILRLHERGFQFHYPLLVLVLSVGFTCALFCPPYYAMGVKGEGRLINVIYFTYTALLLFNTMYILGWLKVRCNFQIPKRIKYLRGIETYIPICLCVALLCTGMLDSNGYKAVKDISSGDAETWSRENYERVEFLTNTEYDDVFVMPFTVYPELLYFDDITYNINDWRNCAMAYYYDLNTVQKGEWTGQAIW